MYFLFIIVFMKYMLFTVEGKFLFILSQITFGADTINMITITINATIADVWEIKYKYTPS